MKKLPPGSEASNVLVGEVDFLSHTIIAFVRLADAVLLGDLTEVPIPTRFLFILLGPKGCQNRYHEIGRAIATLMADEVSMYNVTHFFLLHDHNLLLSPLFLLPPTCTCVTCCYHIQMYIILVQVFHEVAYKARNREDLLAGVDEFLDKVSVCSICTNHCTTLFASGGCVLSPYPIVVFPRTTSTCYSMCTCLLATGHCTSTW